MDADRTYWLAIALWVLDVSLVICILTPTHYYITAYNCAAEYAQQHYDESHNVLTIFRSAEFWTAAATIVIAIFTIVLACVTGKQARLTRESIDLARKEFIATHRPRVIVRFIQGPFEDAESYQFIWVTIVNIGVNPATVEAFGCDLARRNSVTLQWGISALDASPKTISPVTLISGQRHTFEITAENPDTFDEKFSDACGNQQLCAVGIIRYIDGNGIARETGFFRIYDNGSKSFVASKNNEEEYQD